MYSVKEMFYSLQGEGANAGRPAVFVRFAGCNLWTGLEGDRWKSPCKICDTRFVGTDGPRGGRFEHPHDLAHAALQLWTRSLVGSRRPLCVLTGGEPMLQLDESLAMAFRAMGFGVAIETNGTIAVPDGLVDWITVSPKAPPDDPVIKLAQRTGSELKLVHPLPGCEPERFDSLDFPRRYLQPCDGPDIRANTSLCVRYCLDHPWWSLSIQIQKVLGLQ